MNINEGRALKRTRGWQPKVGPGNGHIMMKKEAKVMRRLQAETGLSEEEIRCHKKYRRELSGAQKNNTGSSEQIRYAKRLLKGVTRDLKLAKQHPDVIEEAKKRCDDVDNRRSFYYHPFHEKGKLWSLVRDIINS